jgi:uncharacterized protein involved in exopolysaccharide biosynthesis/Mrp family chromosome partitioning ATPase
MARSFDAGALFARQKWVVLGTVLLTISVVCGLVFLQPPAYQAQARVMIDPSHSTAPGLATEAETIRSTALASEAITVLHLESDPEFARAPAAEKKFLSLSVGQQDISPELLENFMNRLEVRPVEGSYVLAILFTSADPEKAALIANTLAELYVQSRSPVGHQEHPELAALQDGLKKSEERLAQLRQAAGRLQTLRQEEREARAEREKLAERYGPRHPRMVSLDRRLADLASAIQADSSAFPAETEQLEMLEQQIAASRHVLDTLAKPILAEGEGARVVSAATPPATAMTIFPAWGYVVALLGGLLLGLLIAVINEKLDKRVGTIRRLEALTSLTCLASIPLCDGDGPAGAHLVLQKPASALAGAVRTLRASLKLIGEKEGRSLRVITVTSPSESEARPLLSIWLARLAARAGEKVLLIDANLRAPSLHTLLERSNTPSLVDYLTGQTHLEQIIWKQDPSGAHVIFASAVPNTAPDLIGSAKMTKLMGYLRQGYDLVIFCAPGCLNSADASLLANESDYTLYVVDAKATDKDAMLKGLKLFAGFGYTSLSPVLMESR